MEKWTDEKEQFYNLYLKELGKLIEHHLCNNDSNRQIGFVLLVGRCKESGCIDVIRNVCSDHAEFIINEALKDIKKNKD